MCRGLWLEPSSDGFFIFKKLLSVPLQEFELGLYYDIDVRLFYSIRISKLSLTMIKNVCELDPVGFL